MYPSGAADALLRNRCTSPPQLGTGHVELVPGRNLLSIMSARNGNSGSQPLLQAGSPPSERSPNSSGWAKARARAHDLVEGSIDTWFEFSLLGVIFLNVVALVIGTLPVDSPDWCDLPSRGTQRIARVRGLSSCCLHTLLCWLRGLLGFHAVSFCGIKESVTSQEDTLPCIARSSPSHGYALL
jgi:hypothetical protein